MAEPQPEPTEAQLLAEGWKRCFVADEPRLSESVETYRELGFEVTTRPLRVDGADEAECTACLRLDPDRFRVIYTRKLDSE